MRVSWIGIAALTLAALLPLACEAGAPYLPASDTEVLQQLAPPRDARLAQLRTLQSALATHPDDLAGASAYARAAIELGRQEQDPRDFGYAQSALGPWWNLPRPPTEARLLRATLEQWRHEFPAAIHDLDAIIAADADETVQAHLTRASLREVLGNPLGALQDCISLIGHTDLLTVETCITGANSLRGQATTALRSLDAVIVDTHDPAPPAVRLWALTQASEISERLGASNDAARRYGIALAYMDRSGAPDPYLLAAWADFELDRHQPQAVIDRLSRLERIDNLLLRLALAEQQSAEAGDRRMVDRLAEHRQALADRFAETRQRGDTMHLREEAMFELELQHNTGFALQLATQNWSVQKEPLDARALLSAAIAAQQPSAAQPALDWMNSTRIEDARLSRLAQQLPQQFHGQGPI